MNKVTIDGVILCSARLPDNRLLPLLKRHSSVALVNSAANETIGAVQIDDAFGTMRAVQHLLASGRSKIGLLAGPPTPLSQPSPPRTHHPAGRQAPVR